MMESTSVCYGVHGTSTQTAQPSCIAWQVILHGTQESICESTKHPIGDSLWLIRNPHDYVEPISAGIHDSRDGRYWICSVVEKHDEIPDGVF